MKNSVGNFLALGLQQSLSSLHHLSTMFSFLYPCYRYRSLVLRFHFRQMICTFIGLMRNGPTKTEPIFFFQLIQSLKFHPPSPWPYLFYHSPFSTKYKTYGSGKIHRQFFFASGINVYTHWCPRHYRLRYPRLCSDLGIPNRFLQIFSHIFHTIQASVGAHVKDSYVTNVLHFHLTNPPCRLSTTEVTLDYSRDRRSHLSLNKRVKRICCSRSMGVDKPTLTPRTLNYYAELEALSPQSIAVNVPITCAEVDGGGTVVSGGTKVVAIAVDNGTERATTLMDVGINDGGGRCYSIEAVVAFSHSRLLACLNLTIVE
ncbi:Uncharacterized protein TCM_040490 [Theobroma cacao]|uniref:Uncharacterized protein n=1 Tax=Theobroma cacao TaxID=3641 RepID=A0A061GTK8_THECC|nr:Uncharacterized protein TCM_040490 [Theobroma cacao]